MGSHAGPSVSASWLQITPTSPAANGLYTQTFVFAMNKDAYEALPDDLKAVIDANSGIETAAMFGRVMDEGDEVGLAIARELGNNIITLDEEETQRWKDTASPLIDSWIEEMTAQGMDAAALVEEARALVENARQLRLRGTTAPGAGRQRGRPFFVFRSWDTIAVMRMMPHRSLAGDRREAIRDQRLPSRRPEIHRRAWLRVASVCGAFT